MDQEFPCNAISFTRQYLLDLIEKTKPGQYHLIIRMEAFKPRKNDLLMTYLKFEQVQSLPKGEEKA